MGGRYYLTGVQLGMLIASAKYNKDNVVESLCDEIEGKQYICEKEEFNKLIKRRRK